MADVYRTLRPVDAEDYRYDQTGSNPIELGDLVCWDTSGRFQYQHCTGANGPYFIGVSENHGPTPTSNIQNAANLLPSGRVRQEGLFTFKTTAGDLLSHGDPLVVGADPQTVLKQTNEAATEIIAYVHEPKQPAAITGAAGVTVTIRIAQNFPAFGLN
jgi:hypothetical protein